MIARLVTTLMRTDLGLSADDIADALWLALQINNRLPGRVGQPPPSVEVSRDQDAPTESLMSQRPSPPTPQAQVAVAPRTTSLPLYPRLSRAAEDSPISQRGIQFRSPAATALPGKLGIGRALRPLMRRVPSRTRYVLDERATAERVAEKGIARASRPQRGRVGIWTPILRPAKIRWFDVALVVDAGASMMIWRQTINELRQLLEHHGAFRDVRVWSLDTDTGGDPPLYLGLNPPSHRCRSHSPFELIDPSCRRLIMLISDCVSSAWYTGAVARTLVIWGRHHPVAIAQVLPERLWPSSALGWATTSQMQARSPGAANTRFEVEMPWYGFDSSCFQPKESQEPILTLPVPIFTLDEGAIAEWAKMTAGAGGVWTPGCVLSDRAMPTDSSPLTQDAASSPEESVDLFRATTSPEAFRLAELLAAAPLTLPVIRLVQRTMMQTPRQVHIAEVFLSGLLRQVSPDEIDIDPNYILYDFIDNIRDILLKSSPVTDSIEVFRQASAFIARRVGQPFDLQAVLADPAAAENLPINGFMRPYASVAVALLRRLGGVFTQLADRLEQRMSPNPEFEALLGRVPTSGPAFPREPVTSPAVHHITAKVVLVGDSGVGKTALGWRLAHGEFKEQSSMHGQQFWVLDELKHTRGDGAECEVMLWDLAGQPDYRLIHALFLDDADLALVLFNPTNRQEPMHGVDYWLKALAHGRKRPCHTILVGARIDVGDSTLTRDEIDAFCRDRGIGGGYIATSARRGDGLGELVERMKGQIGWDDMPATVTTDTFKRIKDFVLLLREDPARTEVLTDPASLRRRLQETDPDWTFSDAEMMTAVEHLANYGYVRVIRTSTGEQLILLAPELLNNLAASFVLEARRNPRGLGALEEGRILKDEYAFPELNGLGKRDCQTLLDAATTLFLEHNLCFRETHGQETYLIFPELINQKKPRIDEPFEPEDDVSYTVSGDVENAYAALVVLLGYTNVFTRTNQWQNQAQYAMREHEVCGFRQSSTGLEGEIEFVLYYAKYVGQPTRLLFQGLFERFLTRRRVQVTRYRPVICGECGYRQGRWEVIRRVREKSPSMFCSNCGERVDLVRLCETITPAQVARDQIDQERATADLRTKYESALVTVKSFARKERKKRPTCFISYAWGERAHEQWVEKRLARDLQNAGIEVVLDRWDNAAIGSGVPRFISLLEKPETLVVVVGSPQYRRKYENKVSSTGSVVAAEVDLIHLRCIGTEVQKATVFPALLDGDDLTSFPPLMRGRVYADFRREESYFLTLFDLILAMYGISFKDPAVAELREVLNPETFRP